MDEKSRLKIPSAFRRILEERYPGGEFFITSTTGDHARIYPMQTWEEIEAKLAKVSGENISKKRFLDHTNYYGLQQQMDAQGRLVIHSPLRTDAELQGEVIVIGYLNYLEVWNADRFRRDRLKGNPYTDVDAQALEALGI